jgi:hypothetical protein
MKIVRRLRGKRLLAASGLATFAPAAFALCSGFTDVDAAPPFCTAVDWLRNRAITLGCTSSTLYCPNNAVTRLQMAAFMNRLGTALTPTIVYEEEQGGSTVLDATNVPRVCETADVAPATYPRAVSFGAVFNTQAGAKARVGMAVVISEDGGPWTPQGTAQQLSGSGTSRWVNGTTWQGNIALNPGTSYKFALLIAPVVVPSTLNAWSCQLKGIVASRTGGGVPH